MTQTFDLNKMGLAPMDDLEMQEVDGGWVWWVPFAIGLAGSFAYEFLVGAAEGFVKGKSVDLT